MSGRCCAPGRFGKASVAIVPGASILLLPKCPLCLAAWLTFATGIHFSASGATSLRAAVAVLSIITVTLAITKARALRISGR